MLQLVEKYGELNGQAGGKYTQTQLVSVKDGRINMERGGAVFGSTFVEGRFDFRNQFKLEEFSPAIVEDVQIITTNDGWDDIFYAVRTADLDSVKSLLS